MIQLKYKKPGGKVMDKKILSLRIANKVIFFVGVAALLLFPIRNLVTCCLVANAHTCVANATEDLEKARESKYPSFKKKENVIFSHEESLNEALELRRSYNHSSAWWISSAFARASASVKAMRFVASVLIFLFVFLVLRSNIQRNRRRRAWKEQKKMQHFRAERAAENAVQEAQDEEVYQELLRYIP